MISLIYVFWMFVCLFAVIGMLRGWAKELLVSFAAIVAVALNFMLVEFIPFMQKFQKEDPAALFWLRVGVLVTLVYFGYQTVISLARLAAASRREHLQDSLFGIFLGAVNGYLVVGTLWFYLHEAGYPGSIVQPITDPVIQQTVSTMINYMPPHVLGSPGIYFAVIIVLVFILVVYV